jgi:hypothetical protein
MKPTVILVGADKGGVGKTTVSRALLDYLAANNILARAFDTESPRGTLMRFHPAQTEVVDITSTPDQMKILDTLETSGPKVSVIDVRAGQLATTLQALQDVGFLDAVKEGRYNFIVLHILGSSIASLDEIAETVPYVSDAAYFLVKNFINDTTFFEWSPQTYSSYFKQARHAGEIVVPKLNEMAYEQVELAGVPFSAFASNKKADGSTAHSSFVLRGYVRTWLKSIAAEFDRVGLPAIIEGRPVAPKES